MSLLYIMENSSEIKEFCTEALKAYLEALESEKIKILISFYGCIQMKVTLMEKEFLNLTMTTKTQNLNGNSFSELYL